MTIRPGQPFLGETIIINVAPQRLVPFTELFRRSAIPRPTLDSFDFVAGDNPVAVPAASRLHAGLLRGAISEGEELCIVTPTADVDDLHLLALDALLSASGSKRDVVFVLSSDTAVRERFRELRPPMDRNSRSLAFSEAEMPVANVRANGKLSPVTESAGQLTPRFLFSYTSKRIPSDTVGERVACVLFDESVKVTEDRLNELRSWRLENDVPAIVYFTSDPLSDLYDVVESDATVWTWPMELLEESVGADNRRRRGLYAFDGSTPDSADRGRVESQLRNRADGVEVEINVPGGEEIEELLGTVRDEQFDFEKLVHELDADVLWNARISIRYGIREFEELLAPIDLTERHASGRSISTRLSQLERYASTIGTDPEASPAAGAYRDVLTALQRLRERWPDVPARQKKQGQLIEHLMAIDDANESVAVVAPTTGATQAVATHLQAEYETLYERLGEDLHLHGPDSVRRSVSVNHTLLYGAPRYDQRDLLRLSIAPHSIVLAYPTELRLLQSQVDSLETAFDRATEGHGWELAESATTFAHGTDDVDPTPERIDVTVPAPEERTTSELTDSTGLRAEGEEADLAEIVRTFDPDYRSPTEDSLGDDTRERHSGESQSRAECVILETETGGTLYYRPTHEVPVLRPDHEEVLSTEARDLSPGDVVLHFEDTDEMREKLYGLIRDRGDAKLAFHAESWRVFLEQAIDEYDDDLDEFISRVNEQLNDEDYKTRQTYRRWYNLDVRRTRKKESMWAIARAYDLSYVQDNFDTVWNAVHTMENLYKKLKDALSDHALRAVTSGDYEDTTVSEHPRIQLSDFDIERHLYQCVVTTKTLEDVPISRVGTYRR